MSKIKSNFFYNLIFTLSNIIFPIVSFPYAAHILGPQGIGKVQFVLSYVQYFVLISAIGIPLYGIREIAKIKSDKTRLGKLFSELLIINFLGGIIMLLVYFIVIYSFVFFKNDIKYYLTSAIIIFFGFTTIDWFYAGIEEFKYISIRSITIKAIALICLFLFVRTENDLFIYFAINIFSIVANNVWNIVFLKNKTAFGLSGLNFKKHMIPLIALFSTSLSTSIYTVMDTVLLRFFSNDTAVGYYTAAIKLNKIAIPIVVSMGIVLIPQITNSIKVGDDLLLKKLSNDSFSFICLLAIPICVGLYINAPEAMVILSGNKFNSAILTMQLASPLVILVGLGHIFGLQLLIPSGNEKKYLIATIFGMLASISFNFVLIKLFQDKGAAISTVIGEIVVSAISYYFVRTKLNIDFDWSLIIKALISSLPLIPITLVIKKVGLSPSMTLCFSVFFSILIYFFIQMFFFKENLLTNSFSKYKNKITSGKQI